MSLYEYVMGLGSCRLWHCYRRGDARDLSGYANHGVITATSGNAGFWNRTHRGHAYNTGPTGAAGRIVVTDAASIRSATQSIVLFLNMKKAVGYGTRIISRRNAGGTDFDIYGNAAAAGDIETYDGAVTRATSSLLIQNRKQLVIVYPGDAQTPLCYADGGAFAGSFSGTVTRTAPSGINLDIGSGYTGGSGFDTCGDFWDAMIFNAALSATEIGYLWEKWNQAATPDLIDRRYYSLPPRKDVRSSCVCQLDIAHAADGAVPDLSGNGNQGLITHPVALSDGILGQAMETVGANSGAGRVTVAAAASINTLENITLSAWVRPDSSGGGTVGYVISKTQWTIYNYAGLSWAMSTAYAGAGAGWTWPLNAAYGIPYHLCITHARAVVNTAPKVYINGTEVTVTPIATGSGALASDSAYNLIIGASATGTSGHDGTIEDVRIYNAILSAAEVRALYLEGARKSTILTPRFAYPVSPAAVSAGGKVGPWEVISGTHSWADDGTGRGVVCATAGTAAMQQPRAFGSWYLQAKKSADGNVLDTHVIASAKSVSGSGYVIRIAADESVALLRWTSGASGATVFTSSPSYVAVGTSYELLLRRSVAGVFTLWIKGGAYTTWTQVGTGTDTTHTSSVWAVADPDASDELRDFRHFVGDMTPTEAEAMELLEAA
jgi:hypothetical protein